MNLSAQSNTHFCATESNFPDRLAEIPIEVLDNLRMESSDIVVRLYVHIIRSSNHTGGRSAEDINQALNILSQDYAPHGIFFRLECIDYLDNSDYHNYPPPPAPCGTGIEALLLILWQGAIATIFTYDPHENGIDLYIFPENSTIDMGAAQSLPGKALFIGGTTFGGTVDLSLSSVISHEMGHCLGLFHTHHGTFPEGSIGPSDPACPELVNGSNCAYCGDYVCDTPADPGLAFNVNPTNCVWTGQAALDICTGFPLVSNTDANGSLYNPLTNNIMSYTQPLCMTSLKPEQGIRARLHLQTIPLLMNCVVNAAAPNPNWVSGPIANINETWDTPLHVLGTVVVPSGHELIIDNTHIIFESAQSGILVEKGGRLLVNNSTLHPNDCGDRVWKGIVVQGIGDIPHNALDEIDPNQGYISLDQATIVSAKVGVQLRATPVPPPQLLAWTGGGKINAQNSQFINCSVGIEFRNYKHENPSLINECQFLIQNGFSAALRFPSIGHVGIYAQGNHTLHVTDCQFRNENPNDFEVEQRGVGIVAKSSNFIIGSTDGDDQGNEFEGLHKGIDAYSTNSLYGGMYIYTSTFTNTKRGITLNGCAMSEVAHNDFHIQQPGSYGIYALSSGGTTIAHNRFMTHLPLPDPTSAVPPQWGAVVSNAGNLYDTYVYNNIFTHVSTPSNGQFYAASQVETPGTGQNRYVYIDCNRYSSKNRYDLYIDNTTPTFSNQGGCNPIDFTINPTANLWHSIPTGTTNQHHIYYANTAAGFQITCLPGSVPTVVSSNVEVFTCNIDPNGCDLFADIGGEYAQRIADIRARLLVPDLSDRERDALFSELLRSHVKAKQYAAAKADLESRDLLSDRKLLTATYADEYDLAAATAKLAQIPLDEQPNIDFYNLFTALIDDLETNPTPEYEDDGSGKMEMPLPQDIETQGLLNDKTAMNIVAQSLIAQRKGSDYWRTPNYKHSTTHLTRSNNSLLITPNPAHAQVTISAYVAYATNIAIYDCTGRLVQTTVLYDGAKGQWQINIPDLSNGIYICHLLNGTQQVATGKLAIIK